MTEAEADRLHHLEQAHIDLLERVSVMERALRFELEQRERLESIIQKMAGLPKRIDRLEALQVHARNGRRVLEAGE